MVAQLDHILYISKTNFRFLEFHFRKISGVLSVSLPNWQIQLIYFFLMQLGKFCFKEHNHFYLESGLSLQSYLHIWGFQGSRLFNGFFVVWLNAQMLRILRYFFTIHHFYIPVIFKFSVYEQLHLFNISNVSFFEYLKNYFSLMCSFLFLLSTKWFSHKNSLANNILEVGSRM